MELWEIEVHMQCSSILLLCGYVLICAGCAQTTPMSPSHAASFVRSSFDSWETYESKQLGIQFEKPAGRQNLQEGGRTLTLYLHGVSVATSFPSDTQYLITFSVEKYTKQEWQSRFGNMTKVDPSLEKRAKTDPKVREWVEFRKWFYSLNPEVTMRNHQGRKYYRRSLVYDQNTIININTEYVPVDESVIAEDDITIRRMMATVTPIIKNRE